MTASPKPELVAPLLAVSAWKHRALVQSQAEILRIALKMPYFSPGDVDQSHLTEADRHGVASNCWTALRAAGIISRMPITTTMPGVGIFGGRTRNNRPEAKGRWTSVYTLANRGLALAWLKRHGFEVVTATAATAAKQAEMKL